MINQLLGEVERDRRHGCADGREVAFELLRLVLGRVGLLVGSVVQALTPFVVQLLRKCLVFGVPLTPLKFLVPAVRL